MVLPYFTPPGIPYFDTLAIGVVLGLKISAKKGGTYSDIS
jgi:hypothetical protein